MRPSLAVVTVLALASAALAQQGSEKPGSTREWIRKETAASSRSTTV
jgi:hypothetical protein